MISKSSIDKVISSFILVYLTLTVYTFYYGGYLDTSVPIEAREMSHITSILAFVEGNNPFSFDKYPQDVNFYSAVWPYIIGNIYQYLNVTNVSEVILHTRNINFFIALITIALLFSYVWKVSGSYSFSFLTALIYFFAASTKSSMGAQSYTLGMSLFLVSMMLSFGKATSKRFLLASICVITSALFKPYFGIGALILFFRFAPELNKKDYFVKAIFICIFAIIILLIHNQLFPSHFFGSLGVQSFYAIQRYDGAFLNNAAITKINEELLFFLNSILPYIPCLFFAGLLLFKRLNSISYKAAVAAVGVILFIGYVVVKMWPHTGNFGQYSLNLLVPLTIGLVVGIINNSNEHYRKAMLVCTGLGVAGLLNWQASPDKLSANEMVVRRGQVEKIIKFIDDTPIENVYIGFYLGFPTEYDARLNFDNGNTNYVNHVSLSHIKKYQGSLVGYLLNASYADSVQSNLVTQYANAHHDKSKLICSSLTCSHFELSSYREIDSFPFKNTFGQNLRVYLYEVREDKSYGALIAKQLSDLTRINNALNSYFIEHGSYPKSVGFDGLISKWGKSSETWIEGLVPKYLDKLPADPRGSIDPTKQYIYFSNGKDFKLIVHNMNTVGVDIKYRDPKRAEYAFGFWSINGRW